MFKLLQTPLLAFFEALSGFRALSLSRGILMLGVCAGVCFAELGTGSHATARQFDISGVVWALVAVVATSTFKVVCSLTVSSGTKPAQFLLDIVPFSTGLLLLAAVTFEPQALRQLFQGVDAGGLGPWGLAVFFASGVASYLVQFSQAIAIGTTSALAHAMSGQAKTASMLVAAPVLYGEETSLHQFAGGAIAILCLVAYVHVNLKETEAEQGSGAQTRATKP